MPATWPGVGDLQALLVGAGILTDPPSAAAQLLPWDTFLAAAIARWEAATGYKPFLAGAAAVRRFSPSGAKVVRVGGLAELVSITIGGTLYTEGVNVFLMPEGAAEEGKPYQWLEFAYPLYGSPRSIVVNGKWGHSTTIPDDAFLAVLSKAAEFALPDLQRGITSGLIEWSEGDVKEKYGDDPFEVLRTAYQNLFETAAGNYIRVSAWL